MYNREYYENQRIAFYNNYDVFTSGETSLQKAVMKSAEEQDKRLEESFAQNEYLKEFTEIAYNMQIETVNDFEEYLAKCLGGKPIDGFRQLKNKNDAFYSSSKALACCEKPLALRVAEEGGGEMLWKEKKSIVTTWNRVDGFTKNEITISEPVMRKELESKLKWAKIFPNYKKRRVNDIAIPVHSIVAIFVCMAVLMLPVLLSVVCNEAEVQNKEYDAYIRELNAEIEDLENEVALKKDMDLINTLAREEYGMIDVELSQIKRVEISQDSFVIEDTEEKEEKSMWVILLSAIGIISEDN